MLKYPKSCAPGCLSVPLFPSILHTISHTPPYLPLKLLPIFPPKFASLNIRGALIIWAPEHANH
jgi:hypothetical protein